MFASRAADACDDPDAAPGAYKGDHPAPRRGRFRRGVQNMFWIYAGGLVFLIFAVAAVAEEPGSPVSVTVQLVVIIAVVRCLPRGRRGSPTLGSVSAGATSPAFVALLASTAPWWGWSFVNYGVYVSIMLATLIPWRQARVAIPVWNGLIAAVAACSPSELTPIYIALIGGAVGLATGAAIQAGRIGARLHRAEQRVSALALAAERERIGRDLHDILGHSLTAISIKADLAERLLDRRSGMRPGPRSPRCPRSPASRWPTSGPPRRRSGRCGSPPRSPARVRCCWRPGSNRRCPARSSRCRMRPATCSATSSGRPSPTSSGTARRGTA